MPPNRARLNLALAAAARDPRRSPLFHWMVRHHARLAATLKGPRVDWAPLIASAAKAGALTADGHEPTALNMRRTWRNVRAAMAAEKTAPPWSGAATPARRHHPRDMPADAKPRVATSPASGGRFDRPSVWPKTAKDIVNAKDPNPEELLAGLRRVLDEESGRR